MSALERKAAFEFEYAAHRFEHEGVGLPVESLHHADEVARRGNRGANTVTEALPVRASSEILVPARARRLGALKDLQIRVFALSVLNRG
jgi:hypothetical protein